MQIRCPADVLGMVGLRLGDDGIGIVRGAPGFHVVGPGLYVGNVLMIKDR